MGDDGAGKLVVHEPMYQVGGVAHPLIWNSARKISIQPEFAIYLRIKGTIGFRQEPLPPIRVLLTDLTGLRPATPTGPVIIPDHLHFAHVSESAGLYQVMGRARVRFAAMLRANLH